ncbi:hypothetical protein ABTM39_19945, partial [Acinetobacter baumannii]
MAKAVSKKSIVTKGVAKKAAPVKKEKEIKIKYADKSAGQPEMFLIFEKLKKLMEPYAKGSIKAHEGTYGQINLVSHKPVEIAG